MELLHHGVGQSVVALGLGHESVETTQIYMHADLRLKEKALARVSAPESKPGRYRPDDSLLAFLAKSCRTAASDCLVFRSPMRHTCNDSRNRVRRRGTGS